MIVPWLIRGTCVAALAGCTGDVTEPAGRGDSPAGKDDGGGSRTHPSDGKVVPLAGTVARLTREQYGYVIKDLLGVDLGAELNQLPAEKRIDGFSGLAASLTVFPEHVTGYARLAERVVDRMKDLPGFVRRYAQCQEASAKCRSSFVAKAGALLFRRPLDEREIDVFAGLFADVTAAQEGFEQGAAYVLKAMLQAPQFLYRLERSHPDPEDTQPANGHEIASRLSFLLWSSAPDAELLQAAADGTLATATGLEETLGRMFEDTDRAKRSGDRLVRDLFNLDALLDSGTQRDGLHVDLRQDLIDSSLTFFHDHVTVQERSLTELFTSRRLFGTPEMARWYGLNAAGAGILAIEPESNGPIGLLTQPGILAGMSDRDQGGMVARGLHLEDAVFCSEATPHPPPDIDLTANAAHLGNASERTCAEDRLSRAQCRGCHARFEPLAFVLEPFDGIGRRREIDRHGNQMREDGWIPAEVGGEEQRYENLEAYSNLLAKNSQVQRCLTRQVAQFAFGQRLPEEAASLVDVLHAGRGDKGDRYRSLLATIITHPSFSMATTEAP